jgi:predicted NUDIX family NTP pyrophosphohydrolase
VAKLSAGLLVYRPAPPDPPGEPGIEVLIVHPGGPYWAGKDAGAWSIPKGEHGPADDPWATARREFLEELGLDAPEGPALDLGQVIQAGGKHVQAWAVSGDVDVSTIVSNTFELEWPPRSGERQSFPEVDRAEWVTPATARAKLIAAQAAFLDRLLERLADGGLSDQG